MPQTTAPETAQSKEAARGLIEHCDAVRLTELKAALDTINAAIPREIAVGNDVSAMRARRVALADQIASLEEEIAAYPLAKRETEQAELLKRVAAAREVREENQRKAAEAQRLYDDLTRQADEAGKQGQYWKYQAPDSLFTAVQNLERHRARFGDLSGGQ